MQFQQIFLLLTVFVACGFSQQVVPTGCNYTVQQNFTLDAYLGRWFEIEATNHIEEIGSVCQQANYSPMANGSLEVVNSQVQNRTGEWVTMTGYAVPLDENSTEAKFLVSFPSVGAYNAPYWVMESDYNQYSIVLSCRPYGNGNSIQTMWFLARQKTLAPGLSDYVHNKIAELGLDQYLTLTPANQENCPPQ